jgi:hypothetical protein
MMLDKSINVLVALFMFVIFIVAPIYLMVSHILAKDMYPKVLVTYCDKRPPKAFFIKRKDYDLYDSSDIYISDTGNSYFMGEFNVCEVRELKE